MKPKRRSQKFTENPTPYIWAQEREKIARADCGCRIEQHYDEGPAFYQCALHQYAGMLLDAAKNLLDSADDMGESKNDDGKDWSDYRELRQAIKKAGGHLTSRSRIS